MFCLGAPGVNLISAPLLSHTIFERQSNEQILNDDENRNSRSTTIPPTSSHL